jgi:transposase
METERELQTKYKTLKPFMDERTWRLTLAADARSMGHGGISRVAKASGVSRMTIYAGIRELKAADQTGTVANPDRVRKPGAGRKQRTDQDPSLLADLNALLDPVTRGDPMSPLRWTSKSTPKLTAELRKMGHQVSQPTVWRLMDELGFSMQSNRKSHDGSDHPDRDLQFQFINESAIEFMRRGDPVISVDTKKKELVGDFKNTGREWQKKGEPITVRIHDFVDPDLGKAIPYGVYDIGRNEGWVSVGITHDTAEFAVETIRQWWKRMGKQLYPSSQSILITADGGGSNGSRVRLWKWELCRWAEETGLTVHVRHYPPGTSKWNKIEHRMFCHISENWRGRPLVDLVTIIYLISATRTTEGLRIRAAVDEFPYPTGQRITDEEMANLPITSCEFHSNWNYSVSPISNCDQNCID